MNKDVLQFKSLLDVCDRHEAVLKNAMTNLENLGPITGHRVDNLNATELMAVDQFIYRYCRLQDTVGGKLLPKLLQAAGEPVPSEASFVDQLDHCERIGIVRSAQEWREARSIRNRFSHDYPDAEERAESIKSALTTAELLFDTVARVHRFAARQKLGEN